MGSTSTCRCFKEDHEEQLQEYQVGKLSWFTSESRDPVFAFESITGWVGLRQPNQVFLATPPIPNEDESMNQRRVLYDSPPERTSLGRRRVVASVDQGQPLLILAVDVTELEPCRVIASRILPSFEIMRMMSDALHSFFYY